MATANPAPERLTPALERLTPLAIAAANRLRALDDFLVARAIEESLRCQKMQAQQEEKEVSKAIDLIRQSEDKAFAKDFANAIKANAKAEKAKAKADKVKAKADKVKAKADKAVAKAMAKASKATDKVVSDAKSLARVTDASKETCDMRLAEFDDDNEEVVDEEIVDEDLSD